MHEGTLNNYLYSISAGSLDVLGNLSLSYGANANQTGGTVYVNSLDIGSNGTNGHDAYNYNSGNLTIINLSIGSTGGTFSPGATFVWLGNNLTAPSNITLTNGGNFSLAASNSTADLGSNITLAGTGVISVTQTSSLMELDGVISGAGDLDIAGGSSSGGIIELTGNNTYSGDTFILNSAIAVTSADALGTGNVTVDSGGIFELFGQSISGHTLILNGVGYSDIGALVSVIANSTWEGNITLASNSSIGGSAMLTITGNVSGNGTLAKLGNNTLFLSGNNTWAGGINISQGTVVLGSSTALPLNTNLTLGNGLVSGTLDLAGNTATVDGLSVTGSGTSNIIGSSSTTASSTLTFASGTSTFGGTIQDTLGIGNQTIALVISSGNLTLSSNNTYSGGTTVNGGTLTVTASGSATGTGNVTLNGGSLFGNGTISGSVLAGSGPHTINPGGSNSTATLTIGGLSTNANTTLAFDLGSPTGTNDLLQVNGNITLSNGTLAITSQASTGAGSLGYYAVISYTGTLTGTRAGITLPAISGSYVSYTLETTLTSGVIDVHRGFVGDANDNGTVDMTDLNIVENHLGTTTPLWTNGNFSGDTTIDLTDFNDVLNHIGSSIPSGAAVVAGTYNGVNVAGRIEELRQLVWTMQDPLTSDEIAEIQNYAESLGLFAPITPEDPDATPAMAAYFQPIPDFQTVPEPSSLALLAAGTTLLVHRRKRVPRRIS
jgi:fibronectin-binding autotransporter adhesin